MRSYSDEVKAQVMAALLAGQSVSQVANAYKIPRGTVAKWSAAKGETVAQTEGNTKNRIGELLLGYVEETVITLTEQQKVFRDKEWLKTQSAAELATLHGVSADKVVRLLEALSSDEESGEPQ